MKRVLTAAQMKSCDKRAIKNGTPSKVLMERAGAAVYKELCAYFDTARVLFVCGGGNNGGDGLIAAMLFAAGGGRCDIMFLGQPDSTTNETKARLDEAVARGLSFTVSSKLTDYTAIVDAILGIGITRDIEGETAALINNINSSGVPVLAVDIPSGICADTGEVFGTSVNAMVTVTIAAYKRGLLTGEGRECAGKIICADIGISTDDVEALDVDAPYIPYAFDKKDFSLIPKRKRNTNKGSFGRVLIVGGDRGMCGAVYFSALAAYRSGAGLVEILTCKENRAVLQGLIPEAVITAVDFDAPEIDVLDSAIRRCKLIVLGPGLGMSGGAVQIVKYIYSQLCTSLIIDADALNITAAAGLCYPTGHSIIVTPHPGELSRLLNISISELLSDFEAYAVAYAKNNSVICAAKNSVSVITDGTNVFINASGSPALAKAGSGDVLTGVMAGLYCSGLSMLGAAGLGAYAHGLAGELAGSRRGSMSTLARDVADAVGEIFRERENECF